MTKRGAQPETDPLDTGHIFPWLAKAVAVHTRWPADVRMADWVQEHIVLPRRCGTDMPGPFKIRPSTPWVEGWYDAIDDPDIHTVTIKKGAQVAATQTAYNAMCFWMVVDPDPIMLVMPARDDAKEANKFRLMPIIEDSAAIAETLTGKSDDIQSTSYRTKNTFVRFVGANSPGKLASFPHRFVVLDEVDKYKENIGKEGSVVALATQRSSRFWNRFRLIESTPTTKAGYVETMYLLGDQRKFFVPCPECGEMQVLEWAQVKWDNEIEDPMEAAAGAYYECIKCSAHLSDDDKYDMVQLGEWRSTAMARRPGHASFHLSGLYSLVEARSFCVLVAKFLSVKDNKAELQDFINSDLGELWEDAPKSSIAEGAIWDIRDRHRYKRGTIPTTEKFIIAIIADVQKAHLPWCVWAMGPRDSWLVDHGHAAVPDDIAEIAQGPYTNATGEEFSCMAEFYDVHYRTTEMYDWVRAAPRRRAALWGETGSTTTQTAPIRPQKIDRYPDGRLFPPGRGLILHHIHPSYFKDDLSRALTPPELEEGQTIEEALSQMLFRIHFHEDIDRDFVRQITGEVLVEDKMNKFGIAVEYWKKIRTNDFFDIAQYMMAVRHMARADLRQLATEHGKAAKKEQGETTNKTEPARESKRAPEPKGRKRQAGLTFDDDDDGWGW